VSAQIPKLERIPKIERRAECIADPVERLRYLRRMTAPERKLLPASRWRHALWLTLATMLLLAPVSRTKSAAGTFAREAVEPSADVFRNASTSASISTPLHEQANPVANQSTADASHQEAPSAIPHVWRVERSGTSELYSNGLRVDLTFQIANRPRAEYPIFSLAPASPALTGRSWKTGSTPVGIVYHTTESLIAPFEEDQNRRLKQLGRNLIGVIRGERAYHYLIDRFGRVFAAVAESDAANHAGKSVWADSQGIYVNLNDSFLGVAFEAQTGATEAVTSAQIVAAKALTEMLRSRYGIAAGNCVTHAQVSVNPDNMRIAAHTDWGSDFPYAALGLPDNYAVPLASMYAFGFDYDSTFLRVAGRPWGGLDAGDRLIEKQAAVEGVSAARYRAMLRRRYKDIATGLGMTGVGTTGPGTTGAGKSGLGKSGLGVTAIRISKTIGEEAVAEEVAK
jgi:hypothetical protein